MRTSKFLLLPATLAIALIAGAITGVLAVVLFGVIHAITIVPIWDRLGSGILFCLVTGISMGWVRYELSPVKRLHNGAFFGFVFWSCLLPMTLFGIIARITGIHNTESDLEVIITSCLAFFTGGGMGYFIIKRWQAALAMGIATLLLASTQAGPVAVLNSKRAAALFLALLFVYVLSGILLQLIMIIIKHIWFRNRDSETEII